ncbi:MAG: methyltransferase domain-containing protein [Anaerolineae bacterium]|nr:methyltransferase domain-containing protein [Anaerolineae bacterium]
MASGTYGTPKMNPPTINEVDCSRLNGATIAPGTRAVTWPAGKDKDGERRPREGQNDARVYSAEEKEDPTYLDIEAEVGITKHFGGYPATDELYRLCHLNQAKEVLDVGCGIGVGPAYIARRFGCRVVAADISEKMLMWAEKRAHRDGAAAGRTTL